MDGSRHADLLEELERIAEPVARASGVELVEVSVKGSSRRRTIRFDIDRSGAAGIELGDCKRVSDGIGELLETSDVIPTGFVLEVSSPGLDRPIETADDFRRNTGRRVVVETAEPHLGRREFHGVLLGLREGRVGLREDSGEEIEIERDRVLKTRQEIPF